MSLFPIDTPHLCVLVSALVVLWRLGLFDSIDS